MLTYNQNGTSRGVAAITFVRPETAGKAAKELNGLLIDKRPIKVCRGVPLFVGTIPLLTAAPQIEVVLDASRAPPAPAVKPLSERVA
jgi:THO complex subunit 4